MKNELIKLTADKVTISEQGRAAAHKWKPGDKPFVQFIAESEEQFDKTERVKDDQAWWSVDPVKGIDENDRDTNLPADKRKAGIVTADKKLTLDIGSRLEIENLQNLRGLIIRSTTKVNMSNGDPTCETNWEVFPEDLK